MTLAFRRSAALSSRSSTYSLLQQAPANPMPHRITPNKRSSKFMAVKEYYERRNRRKPVSLDRMYRLRAYMSVSAGDLVVAEETAALDGDGNRCGDHVFPREIMISNFLECIPGEYPERMRVEPDDAVDEVIFE
jgi:hypothetical protein